jgi:uncharacterized membrane protein
LLSFWAATAAWSRRNGMAVTRTMEQIARGIEVLGIATLVSGLAIAVVRAANILIHSGSGEGAYRIVRTVFGRSILLGLELLVAADIIRTVAVEPSLENVGVLGLIVLIRTFLSFSLEVEIDGVWPWRRAALAQEPSSPPHGPNGPEQGP